MAEKAIQLFGDRVDSDEFIVGTTNGHLEVKTPDGSYMSCSLL